MEKSTEKTNTLVRRCVNIDWLEVYCLEDLDYFPVDANYYRSNGIWVEERDYGTRQYTQMFTVLDRDGLPFCEIRRSPVAGSNAAKAGIFAKNSCHIKLHNRYCYLDNAVTIFADFLHAHHYTIKRLYRLDLCLDFEKFDKGDKPSDFVHRYVSAKYTKINQCNLSAHCRDRWEERDWNSLSWGSPTSMVSTKLYNKSLELEQVHDKPYIRGAWFNAGLIDDITRKTKRADDGSEYTPVIWRLEFSVKSSAYGWYEVENCNGRKTKKLKQPHDLGCYTTKKQQLDAIAFLCHHYFHFKIYEKDVRKDRCKDKILFDFRTGKQICTLSTALSSVKPPREFDILRRYIERYRLRMADQATREACDLILSQLSDDEVAYLIPNVGRSDQVRALQLLLKRRLEKGSGETFLESVDNVRSIVTLHDVF